MGSEVELAIEHLKSETPDATEEIQAYCSRRRTGLIRVALRFADMAVVLLVQT